MSDSTFNKYAFKGMVFSLNFFFKEKEDSLKKFFEKKIEIF